MVVLPAPHGYNKNDKLIITLDSLQYETNEEHKVEFDDEYVVHDDDMTNAWIG